ncbi:hypothetical protein H7347_01515 [Corynebacterium sp. zg-331]|uniref:hypothetical protein n=1 Tax=unclassified Corynebacterium TaxID=2624378 RepID=UPI00128BB86D|nr:MULTISPECIES: hypothetical protein [unclassified Corynebacterium]MBC3185265.1 hypothetical protein [Corynebacterium sp. zg-331]MPV51762.1 hypothetical protein [Corynebacterium sp. zg331]
METLLAAPDGAQTTNHWFIYLMFAVAGVLVGGTWSAYQNGAKKLVIVCGILAALALTGAIMWLMGGMR